ncbi:tenascin-R-like [Engraulis encrasicolus]|uniref:tenascin-R-like n=1 Tax=Engraulis encrasicolus TaxID=184585 RepID=UPI002FD4D414
MDTTAPHPCPPPTPPGPIQFTSITSDTISFVWGPADPHHTYKVTCKGGGAQGSETLKGLRTSFSFLLPGEKYDFTVVTISEDGQQSQCVSASTYTEVPVPLNVRVEMDGNSAIVMWDKPNELHAPTYVVSLVEGGGDGRCSRTIVTQNTELTVPDLDPDVNYAVGVAVVLENGIQSKAVTKLAFIVSAPQDLEVYSVTATSAKLKWQCQIKQPAPSFLVSYHRDVNYPGTDTVRSCNTTISRLCPGSFYTVSVITLLPHGGKSPPSSKTFQTTVPHPQKPRVVSVTTRSAMIEWQSPHELKDIEHSFKVQVEGSQDTMPRNACNIDISHLQPDTKYIVKICTVLRGQHSKNETVTVKTEIERITFATQVIGNTQNNHCELEGYLINQGFTKAESHHYADFSLAFCVIVSRVGTDMEAALKEITDTKPTLLVVMHHTFDPDYVIPDTSRFAKGRDITVVDVLFHEDKGILKSQKNLEAKRKMLDMAKSVPPRKVGTQHSMSMTRPTAHGRSTSYHITGAEGGAQAVSQSSMQHSSTKTQSSEHNLEIALPSDVQSSRTEVSTYSTKSSSNGTGKVTYSTVVSGNSLGIHEDIRAFIERKTSLTDVPSKEQCDFMLVFCPIVSSVKLDMERACRHIPESKAAILVVMHHTFDPDHVPQEGSGYPKRGNLLVVHCLFHEDQRFLKCLRNTEAIDSIITWLHEKFPRCVISTGQSASTAGRDFMTLELYQVLVEFSKSVNKNCCLK